MGRIVILLLCFFTIVKASTLQELYNNAQPGEGYDKLIILDQDSTYIGGFTQDVLSVCIHGNGAKIDLNGTMILIDGEDRKLDIDHCIMFSSLKSSHCLYFLNNSYGNIINNNFIGDLDSSTYRISCCLEFHECLKNKSNVLNNIFTFFYYAIYFYTMDFNSGIQLNIAHNNSWKCNNPYKYWGGWTGAPYPFTPKPGDQELSDDPMFIDPINRNFNLQNNSPCIDYGTYQNFDYLGTAPDIGALESGYTKFTGTRISGDIQTDLTVDKSPYIISDDINIPIGKIIKVNPGVILKFNEGKSINVYGELRIEGNENDSVYLRNNSKNNNHWGNIIFHKNPSASSIIQYAVIKSALPRDYNYRGCISCNNDSITITHSHFPDAANIYCNSVKNIKISDNVFDNNDNFSGVYVIGCKNSNLYVDNNIFNSSAIECDSSTITLVHNKFMGQTYRMLQEYWLLDIRNSSKIHLESNLFQKNSSAINISGSICNAFNNLIVNCGTSFNFHGNSFGKFGNNTIFMSGSTVLFGVLVSMNSKLDIYNTIIYSKTSAEYINPLCSYDSSQITARYCLLTSAFAGENNIVGDPLFKDIDHDDFHLSEKSPCINSGTPDTIGLNLYKTDFDGNPRITGGKIDMGCYESSVLDNVIFTKKDIPMNFKLEQNFPNPFNPNTRIVFSIPSISNVKLLIYNSAGETLDVLINQILSTGNYSILWDASKYASGVYFYKLITNKFSETKKCILLK